jgi:putative transposase
MTCRRRTLAWLTRSPSSRPLNAQARQAAAARVWAAISRFSAKCQAKRPGKKGYPRFRHHCRSVEYKVTGWQLDPDGRHLTLTDGCGIGRVLSPVNRQARSSRLAT